MAQAKKKTSTKTAKKTSCTSCKKASCSKKKGLHYEKYERGQKSNPFFLIMMSVLAASLLFANLVMMTV